MSALSAIASSIYWLSQTVWYLYLLCALLVYIALYQNIMDPAGHSAVLTDHLCWADDSW